MFGARVKALFLAKHYARMAITPPEKDRQAADGLARAQDRSAGSPAGAEQPRVTRVGEF